MITINQQVEQNRRRTWFVIGGFSVVIAVIGFLIGCLFASQNDGFDLSIALYTTLGFVVVAIIYTFFVYMSTTNILMRSTHAKQLSPDDDEQLFNIVSDLSLVAHIPTPDIYLVDDPAPNAFATGRDPKHSAVAVTQGLRDIMNREELEGVLAHEISHIKNYDIRVSSITVALTTFIASTGVVMVTSGWGLIRNSWFFSDSDDRDRDSTSVMAVMIAFGFVLLLAGWAIRVVGVPVAQIMRFAVSRQRESLADVSGVNLTRDPQGLIDALTVLKNDETPVKHPNASAAALYINEPVTNQKHVPMLMKLFDTHPPLDERIERLEKLLGK